MSELIGTCIISQTIMLHLLQFPIKKINIEYIDFTITQKIHTKTNI